MFAYRKYREQNRRAPARRRSSALKAPFGVAERPFGWRAFPSTCGGFSLLELMVSMGILSLIMGGFISALSTSEQSYARTELGSDMYENVRSVAELLAQEIGQAGLVSLPATTLTGAVAIGATTATVVSQTASMYVGEQLLVDAGSASEELVTLTAVTSTTFTAGTAFAHAHASGAPVTVLGAYPSGIVPVGATDGSTS